MEHAQLGPILTCWRSSEEKEGGWRHGACAVRSYTNLLAVIRGEGEEGGHVVHDLVLLKGGEVAVLPRHVPPSQHSSSYSSRNIRKLHDHFRLGSDELDPDPLKKSSHIKIRIQL